MRCQAGKLLVILLDICNNNFSETVSETVDHSGEPTD